MVASFKCEHNHLVGRWFLKKWFRKLNIDVATNVYTYIWHSCYTYCIVIYKSKKTDEANFGMRYIDLW